jgi:ubiquinone/menaquinone biosynthesis C-methylase UbiE
MTREFYDKRARSYDERHRNQTVGYMQEFEKRFIRNHAFGKTLDIGCGTGRSLLFLENAIGCDPSLEMLKIAREKTNFQLTAAEAEELPFKDSSFDSVICIFTVLNLCDYEQAIIEMNRVLKKGGTAVISVTSSWEKKNYSMRERLLSRQESKKMNVRIYKERLRFHLFSKKDLIDVFERNGFSLREFKGIFIFQKPYWGGHEPFTLAEKTRLAAENLFRFSLFSKAGRMYFAAFQKR